MNNKQAVRVHIPQMWRDGLSQEQICQLADLTGPTVRKVLRAAGLSPADRGSDTYDDWRHRVAVICDASPDLPPFVPHVLPQA